MISCSSNSRFSDLADEDPLEDEPKSCVVELPGDDETNACNVELPENRLEFACADFTAVVISLSSSDSESSDSKLRDLCVKC